MRKIFWFFVNLPPSIRSKISYIASLIPGIKQFRQKHIDKFYGGGADYSLISFPKSGRTWLRMLIGRLLNYHYSLNVKKRDSLDLNSLRILDERVPKFLLTHDRVPRKTPSELAESIDNFEGKKVIFVVRDPRDVVVSHFFERTKRSSTHSYDQPISKFIREDVGGFRTIIEYYNTWIHNKDVPSAFLLVRYEDLQTQPVKELHRVATFLDLKDVKEDDLKQAVDDSTFNKMRSLEMKQAVKSDCLLPVDVKDFSSYKTREGKVGGYKKHLSEQDVRWLNQVMEEHLEVDLGYRPFAKQN